MNLLNRSPYGDLSCAWGVFQSRFTKKGDLFTLRDLKHSSKRTKNSVDCCAGSQEFPIYLQGEVPGGRRRYCPFEEDRLAASVCLWVKSSDSVKGADTQKSKAAGQTAIVLQILGLADAEYRSNGRLKNLRWTNTAQTLHKLKWGSLKLQNYLSKTLKGYGPLVTLVNSIANSSNGKIKNSQLKLNLRFLSTNEPLTVECCGIENGPFLDWDSSSTDALSRSTSAMMGLAASIGIVTPDDLQKGSITAAEYSTYLLEKKLKRPEGKLSYPKIWWINRQAIEEFFKDHRLTKPLTYKFFSPLSTARESTQRCPNCGGNIIRRVKDKGRTTLLNRRLLLIRALEIAHSQKNGCVDLEKLAEYSLLHQNLFLEESHQERVLCTITPGNIALFGATNEVENQFCYPISQFSLSQFDPNHEYIVDVIRTLDEVCSQPGVIVERIR